MRLRLSAVLAAGLWCTPALQAQAPAAPAHPFAAPADTAGPRWITPWDVYLGCRGIEALVAKDPALPTRDPAYGRVDGFCRLSLPRIGARFSRTELGEWRSALAQTPDTVTWNRVRAAGEAALLARLALLGRVSIGGTPLRFDYGKETLSAEQRQAIRQVAESLRTAADSTQVVEVTGYADDDGNSPAANQAQARKRANAVVAELVRNGVDSARIAVSTQVVAVRTGREADRQEARGVALNTVVAGSALATPEARQARAGGLDISTLLVGTTDFLVEEARKQVENYLLQQGAERICQQLEWRQLLRATCNVIPDSAARAQSVAASPRQPLYFPGLDQLRGAIREDLRALPYRVGTHALARWANDARSTPAVRQRAALALYLLSYVDEIGRTGVPLQALQNAGTTMADSLAGSIRADTMEIVRQIRRASALASLLGSARADLHVYWRPEVLADSGALYAMKALALNLSDPRYETVFPPLGGGLAEHTDEVLSAFATAQGLLVSIERGWRQLRSMRHDSAFGAARTALVAQILGDAVDLAVVTVPRGRAGAGSPLALVPPVRELASALAEADAPRALGSLLQLSREVAPGGVIDNQQLRVLSFTTDIAQAREAGEVQAAFQRLVGSGPGFLGKRAATERYWRVNAYVGVAGAYELLVDTTDAGHASGAAVGLAVPIGVEVGWPRHSYTHGVFVQLVDLGAIASARVTGGDRLETFPKFTLGSVVAPGLFYVRSLGGSPFAALAGVAYVPLARETDDGHGLGAFRFSLGAAVDIPLFP